MSREFRSNNRGRASLRGREAPLTVLLRMAADQARAQRVRQLKAEHPELTWAQIAEHVGIKERSVMEWQKTGGMSYANAEKFAELMNVPAAWVWRGEEPPDPGKAEVQLDRIEAKLDDLRRHFGLDDSSQGEAA